MWVNDAYVYLISKGIKAIEDEIFLGFQFLDACTYNFCYIPNTIILITSITLSVGVE